MLCRSFRHTSTIQKLSDRETDDHIFTITESKKRFSSLFPAITPFRYAAMLEEGVLNLKYLIFTEFLYIISEFSCHGLDTLPV